MSSQFIAFSAKKNHLKIHEWLAASLLISLIIILSIIGYFSSKDLTPSKELSQIFEKKIEIIVQGAVENPGIYYVSKQILMDDLLRLAVLSPDANLKHYPKNKAITKSRILNIPKHKMISINIQGAVEKPKVIQVPLGTTLEDLLDILAFKEFANLEPLKRKRKLKANEIIIIKTKVPA